MRGRRIVFLILGGVFIMALAVAAEADGPWFDMVNCEICKHMMDDPEIINHAAYEQHNISNGIINITMVDKEYLDSYHAACKAVEKTTERVKKGEKVQMCGMCREYVMLMQAGAKVENVMTKRGDIMLMTSDNPETVKKIQAWAKRNNDEMAKMEAMEKEGME